MDDVKLLTPEATRGTRENAPEGKEHWSVERIISTLEQAQSNKDGKCNCPHGKVPPKVVIEQPIKPWNSTPKRK